jgi:autotransporter-associated beta strand protein
MISKGAVALVVCLLGGADIALAKTCTWTGLGSAGNWSRATNWTDCDGGAPQAGDSVIFPDGAARPANTPDLPFTLDSVTINGRGAGGVAWAIGVDGTVDIRSLIVTAPPDTGGHGPSFLTPINLVASTTITTNRDPGGASTLTLGTIDLAGHTLTFNVESPVAAGGRISGNCPGDPVALVKNGSSILTLNDNAYCGTTTINAGTVIANASRALGDAIDDVVAASPALIGTVAQRVTVPPGALTEIKAGAILSLVNGVSIGDTLALAGTLTVPHGVSATVTGDVIRTGANAAFDLGGTLTLAGRFASDTTPTHLVSPGTGLLTITGTLAVQLNGLTPGTAYDQIEIGGNLMIGPDAQLVVTRAFAPPKGTTFNIINLAAGKTIIGAFPGAPPDATVLVDGLHFRITYDSVGVQKHLTVALTALDDPPPQTYYLSEGATGGFFDEDILIANPTTQAAPVTLTFSKEDGHQVQTTRTVPAQSHLTVHVDQISGLEATSASAQVTSDAGLPLVVERSMFWDATYYAGHTGSAVDRPAPDWFFAEGSQGFFDTFVLVINPNATPTDVTFTFFRENEPTVVKTVTVGATTRLTLHAGDVPDLVNRSFGMAVHATQPIMAERSMYFGTTPTRLWSGGHESAGVTATSTHWFLAEGATGGFFDTFVLLSNPQDAVAHVTLQYLLPAGDPVTVQKVIPAHARLTTNIEAEDDARLQNAAVSTVVTSDQPIIAERSMYWQGAAQPWGEGHNSFGVIDAGTTWGLSEGRIGGPLNFHTYILLANPQTTMANVTVNYLRENGGVVAKTYTVSPTSRFNIDTSTVTELHDEAFGAVIRVTNGVPIIVERSMYWDSNGFTFSGGTNATGILLPDSLTIATGTTTQISIAGINGNQSFAPNPAAASPGQTITWKNNDGFTHHIVADNGSFDTGNINGGATSASVTVGASSVSYHCSIHPSMVGSITVAASATSAGSTRP